jgi:hypothetical protein
VGRIAIIAVSTCLALTIVGGAGAEGNVASTSQVIARFSATTGETLRVNPRLSYPGHYVALDLGTPSITKRVRYGSFAIYVVTTPDPTTEATNLLADAHTGVLGTPGAAAIFWESGSTLTGQHYWRAKKRYGGNVILTWIGAQDARKIDASFTRLHRALLPLASP